MSCNPIQFGAEELPRLERFSLDSFHRPADCVRVLDSSRPVGKVRGSAGQNVGGSTAMKRQYQPSKIRRQRQHGFRARAATKSGRAILNNRRRVGRRRLTPV